MRAARNLSPHDRPRSRSRLRRSAVGMAVLNLMALALTQPVQAMDAYWAGGEGSWTTGTAWVDGLVPDYADRVFIDALADPAITSTVWVDGSAAASQVFIGAGDALKVRQGSLTLHGGLIRNDGTLAVQGSPYTGSASLNLAANTTLAGSGSTVLTHQDYSYVYGNGHTLTVGEGHTLRGAGYLGVDGSLNVVNKGSVIAEGGVLRVSLGEGRSFNNVAGTVTVADGAVLSVDSGSFNGGTLTGQGSAQLTGGGSYRDTQLAGQLQVAAGTNLRLAGTIASTGTLTVQGSPYTGGAYVSLVGDTTLAGSGSTVLARQDYSYLYGNGYTLTIGEGHTLRGAGYLGLDGNLNVVNKGSVIAEGGVLRLSPGEGRSFNNAAGTVTVADGAVLSLDSGSFSGGTITGQGSAQLTGGGIYRDTQLAGPLQVAVGNNLRLAGTIANSGTLTVQGSPSTGGTYVNLAADTTLAGSGSTVLKHQDYSYVYGNGHTLTIGEGHTLRGAGYLGLDGNLNVVNKGAVIAEGGVLHLSPGEGRSFNNAAGTVTVADGAVLSLDSGKLTGGVIQGQGSAQLAGYGTYESTRLTGSLSASGNPLLQDAQLQGQLQVAVGSTLRLAGTLTNTGTLTVQGSPSTGGAYVNLAADTTLAGSGNTVLTHQDYSYVYGNGHALTIGEGHTLRGAGYLGLDGNLNVVNEGAVIAEGGVLRLSLGEGRSFNNAAGTVTVADGSVLSLDSGKLTGGVIQGQGSAQLAGYGTYESTWLTGSLSASGNPLLQDAQLQGQLQVAVGNTLRLAGTLTNTGTLEVQGSPSTGGASLSLVADTTLAGSGNTMLTHQDYSYVYGNGYTLTIGEGHTLRGVGYLGLDGNLNVVNKGAVIAEGGVLRLFLGEGRSFNNAAGTVTVADGGVLSLDSGSFSGGKITGQGAAQLTGGGVYRDTQLAGQLQVVVGNNLRLAGTLTNTGTLTVQGSPYTGSALLSLAADTTLAGSGNTVLTHQDYSHIYGNGHTLTIGHGHTLRGAGYIGADSNISIVNKGSLVAEGGRLSVNPGSDRTVDNSAGTITVANNGVFSLESGKLTGGVIHGQSGAELAGGGTYDTTRLTGSLRTASNLNLKDSRLEGQLQVLGGGHLGLAGNIINTGTLTLQGSPSTGGAYANLAADTTLAGGGSTVLTHQDYSFIYGNGYTLTIGEGHTLRGAGYIGLNSNINVVNQGSLIAEGGRLTVQMQAGQSFDNTAGLLRVDETGQILLYGDLLLGDASQLVFDVAGVGGQAAWGGLSWSAPATFDGTLRLNFEGYTPTVGQQFSLIQYSGSYSGAFDAALANGYTLSLSYADNLVVATVTGVSPVPEPGTWALWLAGAAAVGAVVRRRSRQDWA